MYAIAFDLDTALLAENYGGNSPNNGYKDIANFLEGRGFTRQQGSVYFGNEAVNPVSTVLAVQEMARALPWFAASVRDIRMLRIDEDNDLNPAITVAALGISIAV